MKKTLLTWGIVLLVIGLLGGLYFNYKNTSCNDLTKKISNVLSGETISGCDSAQTFMYLFMVVGLVGLVLLTVGAVKEMK